MSKPLSWGLCGWISGLQGSGLFKSIVNKPTLQEKVKIISTGSSIPSSGKSVRGPKLVISGVNSVCDWLGLQGA